MRTQKWRKDVVFVNNLSVISMESEVDLLVKVGWVSDRKSSRVASISSSIVSGATITDKESTLPQTTDKLFMTKKSMRHAYMRRSNRHRDTETCEIPSLSFTYYLIQVLWRHTLSLRRRLSTTLLHTDSCTRWCRNLRIRHDGFVPLYTSHLPVPPTLISILLQD